MVYFLVKEGTEAVKEGWEGIIGKTDTVG